MVDDFDDGYDASDYNAEDLSSASQVGFDTYQNNQNQQFGMGTGDDFATGNARDFTIGRDPSNITNFIGPLSGINNVPNVFDLGGGVGDFGFGKTRSQNFLNPQLAEMYKQQEIARTGADLNKNPFAPNIFDTIAKAFGTSVDRTKDLGSQRVQEINDLRARQAFGLPSLNTGLSYTSKDFEAGRDTNQGMVRDLPIGGIESFARSFIPGANFLPTRAAPERSQIYKQAMVEENAPGIMSQAGDYISQMGDLFTGLFSQRPQVQDFDQFSPTRDNRQIEDFDQTGADIPNFAGTSMQDFDQFSPTGSRTFISEATDPNFKGRTSSPINIEDISNPYEENLGMTIKDNKFMDSSGQRFDRARPINEDIVDMLERRDRENNFQDQLNNLSQDQKNFLGGRTDTAPRGINEEELMADASPFSLLKGATGLYKGDINNYLQNNINRNLEFENDFRTIDDELQPYMGVKLGFSTA